MALDPSNLVWQVAELDNEWQDKVVNGPVFKELADKLVLRELTGL